MSRSNLGILGACALVGSFLFTLWLTAPATLPDSQRPRLSLSTEIFATYLVPDEGILSAAAKAAGLQPSDRLKGYIEEATRLNSAYVKIRGWAADELGEDDPIAILVFAGCPDGPPPCRTRGKNVFVTQTKGPRPDVTDALKLSKAAAANTAFEGRLSCNPGQPLLVVAVTQTDLYGALGSLVCPP
jgi:hypothetical protein